MYLPSARALGKLAVSPEQGPGQFIFHIKGGLEGTQPLSLADFAQTFFSVTHPLSALKQTTETEEITPINSFHMSGRNNRHGRHSRNFQEGPKRQSSA
jgi:hypothetical protein